MEGVPMKLFSPFLLVALAAAFSTSMQAETVRWSPGQANAWYAKQPWLVGSNFVPASAINQLEMWQADTFDPVEIDRELGWARQLGFNTMRVFLHNLAWQQDPEGFLKRVDQFLALCKKHRIRPLLVLLDDVWNPDPKIGPQPAPRAGVHNSGWVQSPGRAVVGNEKRWPEVKPYIQAVIGKFRKDRRILAWDLYNEPGNLNNDYYRPREPKNKETLSLGLLAKVFEWAREVDPSQPLTAGVWTGDWRPDKLSPLNKFQLDHSDVISFHRYADFATTKRDSETLLAYGRPVICTEYMARPMGSTFGELLPFFKAHKIGAINWGFVAGKTNTIHAWNTWDKPDRGEPKVWFHDVLRANGTPYSASEANIIRRLTGAH